MLQNTLYQGMAQSEWENLQNGTKYHLLQPGKVKMRSHKMVPNTFYQGWTKSDWEILQSGTKYPLSGLGKVRIIHLKKDTSISIYRSIAKHYSENILGSTDKDELYPDSVSSQGCSPKRAFLFHCQNLNIIIMRMFYRLPRGMPG